MKKFILSSIVFCCLVVSLCQGQECPKRTNKEVLQFDFLDNKFKECLKKRFFPYNGTCHVEIINVNPLNYTFEIEASNIKYETGTPTEFKQVLNNNGFNETTKSILANNKEVTKKAADSLQTLKGKKGLKLLSIDSLEIKLDLFNNNVDNFKKVVHEKTELYNTMKAASEASKWPKLDIVEPKINLYNAFAMLEHSFTELQKQCKIEKVEANGDTELLSHILEIEKNATESFDFCKEKYPIIKNELDSLYLLLANPEGSFKVRSKIIQAKGDEVEINITKITKQTDGKIFKEKWEVIDVPTKGGISFAFSTSILTNWTKNAKDLKYEVDTLTDTTVQIRELPNNNALSIGLSSLMHIYWRSHTNFNAAFSFGFGIQDKIQDNSSLLVANFFVGGSAMFGREQKFALSVGVSFNKVARLNTKYEVNKSYPLNKVIKDDNFTEKIFLPSLSIGISYFIPKRNKQ